MKRRLVIFPFAIFLIFGWLAAPAGAQTAGSAKAPRPAPTYDASKETTLQGKVSNVVTKPGAGMILGGHLIVATSQGAVDAHVGRALQGPKPIAVKAGDEVKLVGVMATVQHKQVFLVRTVEDGGRSYTVRSEHGFLVTSMPTRGSSTTPAKGGVR